MPGRLRRSGGRPFRRPVAAELRALVQELAAHLPTEMVSAAASGHQRRPPISARPRRCSTSPRTLRSTRLLDLVNTMDPKLVAATFGMTAEAVMIYLAEQVDDGRLPDKHERRR